MFKPENTGVENTEKTSVNKFDPGYKILVVIKKNLIQVVGWNDVREIGTRKMTFSALSPWKLCSLLTIYSVTSSAPRGCAPIFFANIFVWLFLIKIYLKPTQFFRRKHTGNILSLWIVKNVLVLEKKLHVFQREKQTCFLDSYPPSAVSSPSWELNYREDIKADRPFSLVVGTGFYIFSHFVDNFQASISISFFISLQFLV